ncbi:MAG: hypothetical protein P4N60_12070 [Verrucomicrobiae bacterium]|nr:hypothetical protein [Verrucomicrobiae bacterium]
MGKTKTLPARPQPLAAGQTWRVGDLNLQISTVGPMLVSYKLGKLDAVRLRSTVSGKSTIEKYLKKNKAVLVAG